MGIFTKKDSDQKGNTEGQQASDDSQQSEPQSKMDKAKIVFNKMYGTEGVQRKDIIKKFISDCELTDAGAATYYTKIKKQVEQGDK